MRLRMWTFVFPLWIGMVLAPLANAQTGGFTPTGTGATAAWEATATLLNNGQVMIVGGITSGGGCVSTAELYNPATGTFSTSGKLNVCRGYGFTATLLNNGMVLIVGGDGLQNASEELYNPTTGTFSTTGRLNTDREFHTATLLPNGEVLIVGGFGTSPLSSAELYNPATGTFSYTGNLNSARDEQTATLLPNGEVLIAGGTNGSLPGAAGALASAEVYNPATGAFSFTGSLETGRYDNTATLLSDGQVLIAGGLSNPSTILSSAELYNPITGGFAYTGKLITAVNGNTATKLNDGTVLIAGGPGGSDREAQVYSPVSGTFSSTGSLNVGRVLQTATLLTTGAVLIAGGQQGRGAVGEGELYETGAVLGYVNPKFIVVGVTYAPPGPSTSTFVNYSTSTTIGTTNSLSQSFMSGDTYSTSLSYGFSIPLVGSGKVTAQTASATSQTTNSSSSVTMTFQVSGSEKTYGTTNYFAPVNHDSDVIWVWVNPAVILTVSNGKVTWNGYGADDTDQPGMDIQGIELGYLNGDFGPVPTDYTCPNCSFTRAWATNQVWPAGESAALNSADYAQIATADPFSVNTYGPNYLGPNLPDPETADHRFTMSACTSDASFSYLQAAPSQTPAIYSCTLTYTNNSTQAKGISTTYSQSFSTDSSFTGSGFLSAFSDDAKSTNTLTWTTGEQSSIASGNSSTATFSVQGPPCGNQVQGLGPCIPVYDSSGNEPTSFYVYEDNLFGTFMFAPVNYY
jgi:hypothetical protein